MKKLIFSILIVILLLGITACGSTTIEKDITDKFETSVFMGKRQF